MRAIEVKAAKRKGDLMVRSRDEMEDRECFIGGAGRHYRVLGANREGIDLAGYTDEILILEDDCRRS